MDILICRVSRSSFLMNLDTRLRLCGSSETSSVFVRASTSTLPRDDRSDLTGLTKSLALAYVSGAVEEGDRAIFEAQLRTVGQGERPFPLSPDAQEFFGGARVKAKARSVVELDIEVQEIEDKIRTLRVKNAG